MIPRFFTILPTLLLMSVGVFLAAGPAEAAGLFVRAQDFPVGQQPEAVATADFNEDGEKDLAVTNLNEEDTLTVSVLLGNGDGTFNSAQIYAVGTSPQFVIASDLDGDARPDVVAANATSNDVSILMNAAPPRISSIDPASGYRNSTLTITIIGSAFGSGAKVALSKDLLSLKALSVERESHTRRTAEVPVPKFAPTGRYDVEVNNPDKQDDTLSQAPRILAPLKTEITLKADPGTLQPGRSTRLSGKLATARGSNLAGEEVILEQKPAGSDAGFRELAALTTRSDGTFRLSGVKPSKNTVSRASFAGDAPDGLQVSRSSTLVKLKR